MNTEAEREAFYDAEIAPALLAIMQKCHDAEMPFLATVEYAAGCYGTSVDFPADVSSPMKWAHAAARCQSNVDALIGLLIADGKRLGHGSIYLKLLGVPLQPSGAEAPDRSGGVSPLSPAAPHSIQPGK